jgi:hypothetical protein
MCAGLDTEDELPWSDQDGKIRPIFRRTALWSDQHDEMPALPRWKSSWSDHRGRELRHQSEIGQTNDLRACVHKSRAVRVLNSDKREAIVLTTSGLFI